MSDQASDLNEIFNLIDADDTDTIPFTTIASECGTSGCGPSIPTTAAAAIPATTTDEWSWMPAGKRTVRSDSVETHPPSPSPALGIYSEAAGFLLTGKDSQKLYSKFI